MTKKILIWEVDCERGVVNFEDVQKLKVKRRWNGWGIAEENDMDRGQVCRERYLSKNSTGTFTRQEHDQLLSPHNTWWMNTMVNDQLRNGGRRRRKKISIEIMVERC